MALDDKPDPEWLWPNGVVVNQTEDEFVWVVKQIYNWRMITVPKRDQSTFRRYWCYEGTGPVTAYVAIYAGMAWSGKGDPIGWSKNGQTGVFRDWEDALAELQELVPPTRLETYHALVEKANALGIIIP